jgi:hypothetical protein
MVNFFYLDKDPKKCAKYYCNKHILKIPIEICQILSKVHYEINSKIDYNKIYKNSSVVKNTIGPYCWVKESLDNYIWANKLGLELINEYKFRYNKTEHKTESILHFLYENLPNLPKIGITKFKGTNKYDMFQYISNDPIICARYNYAEMKCINDKWNKDGPPDWLKKIKKYILAEKKILIKKINNQVRKRLPKMVAKGDKVYRFHSFLRISYDTLFQGKWNIKAKLMNKYDKNKPLIEQLTYPQLYYVYEIAKSIENKKVLSLLNIESLKYRKKLKFPNNKINYKINPEYYLYISNEKSTIEIEPYKTLIYKFEDDCNKLFELFLDFINNNDLIGADMIRKYIQLGINKNNNKNKNLFSKKLLEINNNKIYLNWINSFNWKILNPYKPYKYIL